MNADQNVCPRCGALAGESRWCSSCGLNLEQQGTLPTAEEFEAQSREKEWLSARETDERDRTRLEEDLNSQRQLEAAAHAEALRQERKAQTRERFRKHKVAFILALMIGTGGLVGGIVAWRVKSIDIPLVGSQPNCGDWKGWASEKKADYVEEDGLGVVYVRYLDDACGSFVVLGDTLTDAVDEVDTRINVTLSRDSTCSDLDSVMSDEVKRFVALYGSQATSPSDLGFLCSSSGNPDEPLTSLTD